MRDRNFYCNLCNRKAGSKECTICVQDNNPDSTPSEYISKRNGDDETEQTQKDMVDHPAYYQSKSGLETIDVIEEFTSDMKGIEAFCTGNAIKYLCRWKKKNGIEDLKKARWYLNKLVEHVENSNKNREPDIVFMPNDILICGKSLMGFYKELEKESK